MLKMNRRMMDEVAHIHRLDCTLPKALMDIVFGGFERQGDCYFVRQLMMSAANVSIDDFPDRTGYECFINSVHIDDYTDENYLLCAVKFSDVLISAWRELQVAIRLEVIISADEYGAMVKCHAIRDGEFWVSSDLDGYGEAILICDSSIEEGLIAKIASIVGYPSC